VTDEQLVDVTALVASHRLEREVIEDQHIGHTQFVHDDFARVVHAALPQRAQQVVGTMEGTAPSIRCDTRGARAR
jgi:hypothetical protein